MVGRLQDLFEAVGQLKKVVKKKGSCDITFQKKADALKAVKEYDGILLDGALDAHPPFVP